MWQQINAYAQDAVDANGTTIGFLVNAELACEGNGGKALAKIYLADLKRQANEFDTQLRRFLLAINKDVKGEAEMEAER
jgi:hypothetical protein